MKISPLARYVLLIATLFYVGGCSAEAKRDRALERASAYFKAGEYDKAKIEYLNVLGQAPENAKAIEQLGLIYLEQGASSQAYPFLLKSRTLAPENLAIRLKLARLKQSLGKTNEARQDLMSILERSVGHPEATVLLTETVRTRDAFKAADLELTKIRERNSASFHVATANLALFAGDQTKAMASLKRAVSTDPNSPFVHSAMANLHLLQNRPDDAAAEYRKAAEMSPMRSAARMQFAEFTAQHGAVPEAVAYLQDITRQAPDYLAAWRTLAKIALAQKNHEEALAHLKNVFSREPRDYESHMLRAQVHLQKGESRQGIEELEKVAQAFPSLPLDKYQLAMAHLQNHDTQKAILALQMTVAQEPDNVDAIILLARLQLGAGAAEPAAAAMIELLKKGTATMQAELLLVEAMTSLGRLDEIVRVFGEGIKATPNNPQLHLLLGTALAQQGKRAEARQSYEKSLALAPDQIPAAAELINLDLNEGKHAPAMNRVQSLIANAPDAALVRFLESRVHAAQGQWDKAEVSVTKALELDRGFVPAYGLLLEAFVKQMSQPGTAQRLQDFLARRPNDERVAMLGAQVYLRLNDFSKTRDIYENYLSANPDSGAVLNNLACLYDDQLKEPEQALEVARKARKTDPRSPLVADTLGWILYKRRDYAESFELLKESAAKTPENPQIQFHLGMASLAMSQNDIARGAFQRAVNAKSDFPGKDEAIKQLALLDQKSATTPDAAKSGSLAK